MSASGLRRPLFEVRGAAVERDGRRILDVERFDVCEGEHLAILGPNGAGKSTLIGLLTREVHPLWADPYPVRFLGAERPDLLETREVVGIVSSSWQDVVDVRLSAREVVLGGRFGTLGLPPHVRGRVTDADKRAADAALAELGMSAFTERDMTTLSTGEARRVLIARAIVHDPAVLVLDEPAAGLDPTAAWHLRQTLRDLVAGPRSLVLVTHHVEDIVAGVERTVFVRDGRIAADGPTAELLTAPRLSELFGVEFDVETRDGEYRLW